LGIKDFNLGISIIKTPVNEEKKRRKKKKEKKSTGKQKEKELGN